MKGTGISQKSAGSLGSLATDPKPHLASVILDLSFILVSSPRKERIFKNGVKVRAFFRRMLMPMVRRRRGQVISAGRKTVGL